MQFMQILLFPHVYIYVGVGGHAVGEKRIENRNRRFFFRFLSVVCRLSRVVVS